MIKAFTYSMIITSALFGDHYMNGNKKEILLKLDSQEPFVKNRNAKSNINYYKNSSGKRIGVNNNLIISFEDLSIQLYIEKEYSLTLEKTLNSHMFVYSINDKDQTLDLSNALTELDGIAFAHPDFLVQKENRYTPTTRLNPLYASTWHLNDNRGINAEEAWDYNKGAGIIVGIYDEGIDIEHEDLRDNILGYGNYNNNDGQIDLISDGATLNNNNSNAPAPDSDIWHGTSCAGLIAASIDNGRGSTGVAPEAKLLALRYANRSTSQDIAAFYDMARNGAAIISNSWGTYRMDPAFNAALKELSENGREGKGVLIFFAAGNDGCNMDEYYRVDSADNYSCQSSSTYEAIQDESESPYVISIAASTTEIRRDEKGDYIKDEKGDYIKDNVIADYSNYGSSIDFTAPGSSIVTTDAMGSNGQSGSWNYNYDFSGTSAAAPIAAGIATLVLSQNPALNKEEVLDILRSTAQKNGQDAYDSQGRNDRWGYGFIDAGEATKLASTYGQIQIENIAHKIYKDMH